MRIGVVYDAGSGDWDPKDVAAVLLNVRTVQKALRAGGHVTTLIPVTLGDVRWLQKVQRCDAVFNLCEGVNGIARYEDYAVAALDLTRVPFTGCNSWTVTIAHRKHIANTLFAASGVPVPPFVLAKRGTVPDGLMFPVIVKPSGEDASVGIDSGSVCTTKKALKERLAKLTGGIAVIKVGGASEVEVSRPRAEPWTQLPEEPSGMRGRKRLALTSVPSLNV